MIELVPANGSVYAIRGRVKLDKGDYEGAIADADRAIELDPANRLAYAVRGYARDKGDYEGAIAERGPSD